MAWSSTYADLFVLALGSFDFRRQGPGLIVGFSLKNPCRPEFSFPTKSGIAECTSSLNTYWPQELNARTYQRCFKGTTKLPSLPHLNTASFKTRNFCSFCQQIGRSHIPPLPITPHLSPGTACTTTADGQSTVFLAGAMALHIHPHRPNLVAAGCYNGSVAVFDAREAGRSVRPFRRGAPSSSGHLCPVWGVTWQPSEPPAFHSLGADGRMLCWSLSGTELACQVLSKRCNINKT